MKCSLTEEAREQGRSGRIKRAAREEERAAGRLNGLFSAANVLVVKSITGGMAGSSSTLQPLFYGTAAATAAVFSSVRDLTPPWGVAHEQAYVRARRWVHLHIIVRVRVCVCVCV